MTRRTSHRRTSSPGAKAAPAKLPRREGGTREKLDWLARAISRAGVMPLEDAEHAIAAGRVQLAGKVVRQPLAVIRPGEAVRVDGVEISLARKTRVIAFHKPTDVVTSREDRHARTVFELLRDLLPAALQGFEWHAVGRLDRASTGLLLFTNDERFVAHATSPEAHLPKRYRATLGADATDDKLEPLRRGLSVDGEELRPAKVKRVGPREVTVTITEGKNHQVKRMLGAVGLPVLSLHREAIGGLVLDLPEGGYREVPPEELEEKLQFRG